MHIGVLALQGAFNEHIRILQQLGVSATDVRLPQQLSTIDGLIIPGGESTTIINLMQSFHFDEPLQSLARGGLPIWGTCAGMICLAKKVVNNHMRTLAVMDIGVRRNAFGRQMDSFETDLIVPELGEIPYHAVFIRAPVIESVSKPVQVLASLPNKMPVAARQGKLLATSFHPELTNDHRFHEYFVKMAY